MRFAIGRTFAVGCFAVLASACHPEVLLSGDSSEAGTDAEQGMPLPIPPFDASYLCATSGQCTCTVDNQCIQNCPTGSPTSISGTVYDPAGNNPLYDIAVYVPASLPLPTLPGPPTALVSCPHCADYYPKVVAGDLTDTKGQFKFTHVPVGSNIPLVVQIGKWRHLTHVTIVACQDNPMTDKTLLLPGQAGPDDTLPEIAISTGGADSLECLLERIGVAESEYTNGAGGNGRIHVFQGGGGNSVPGPAMRNGSPSSPTALWPSASELRKYDVAILSCEGGETSGANPTALAEYADVGGRIFASHYHYAWFTAPNGPFFRDNLASWHPNTQDIGDINAFIETGFFGGKQMHDWLANVGALTNDELHIVQARHNADVSASNKPSRAWITADQSAGSPAGTAAGATEYFSFDTPVGSRVEQMCGRVVYSDLHVGAASLDYGIQAGGNTTGGIVPTGCAKMPLSPQEKALEYMLFDLAACWTPADVPPSTNNWPK
ncbi:MAG: hypothetical protein M3O46_06025 [Myxococcota bacterium]|nr:hypothetical protein [Myxococcota bacterium]